MIKCSRCGFENSGYAIFCGECGGDLTKQSNENMENQHECNNLNPDEDNKNNVFVDEDKQNDGFTNDVNSQQKEDNEQLYQQGSKYSQPENNENSYQNGFNPGNVYYASQNNNQNYNQSYNQNPYQNQGMNQNYQSMYKQKNNSKETTGMVLSIIGLCLSLVMCCCGFLQIIPLGLCIAGLITSLAAKKNLQMGETSSKATAGVVCAIIGIVLCALMILLSIVSVASYTEIFNEDFFNYITDIIENGEYYNDYYY